MNATKATLIFAFLCLLSCTQIRHVEAANAHQVPLEATNNDVDCPNSDAAFVTTCSGTRSEATESKSTDEKSEASVDDAFDETFLVNEILDDFDGRNERKRCGTDEKDGRKMNQHQQHDFGDLGEVEKAMQQLKETAFRLTKRYYEPLPRQAKCAVGAVCGFTASRLSLGVANRTFRVAGATWVSAETLHTSGFCDEAKCVPGEVRPWIGIARQAIVKQCRRVRKFARKVWDQDRIRAFAEKDDLVAGGFAVGAFVGFIV
mmetsp:Transcript_19811/g.41573  ORF Transcript_19811/g.41573 Transcript_19811/m.41573 type:complete len:260 (-) Transcript_19811:66-845(-)